MNEVAADEIVATAWDDFDKWAALHDPDGEMGHLERIDAYDAWMRNPHALTDSTPALSTPDKPLPQ